MKQTGFIGCGKMAGAIISAIKNEYKVVGSEFNDEFAKAASDKLGIEVYSDNKKLASESDIIFIATKPNQEIAVLEEIKNVIPLFDYDALLSKLNDHKEMKELYYSCKTGYEKACIFRVMYGKNKDSKKKEKILWKQLNEIYHIENTFLYQLNPIEFDTIPQFIIEQCDNIINSEDECYQEE